MLLYDRHRNHLPRCSTAAVFLGILSFLLEVRLSGVAGWTADFAFALFCCLPASLLACDWAFAFHDLLSQKMPYAYTFGSYFAGKFASQFLIAIHTLQQAGCHPLVMAGTVVFLTWFSVVAWPFRFNDEVIFWKGYLSVQCIACLFAWSILTIYSINYFVHLRALREVSRSDVGTNRFCHNSIIQVPNVSVRWSPTYHEWLFVRRVFSMFCSFPFSGYRFMSSWSFSICSYYVYVYL